MGQNENGYIYVLTNPAFPAYLKIGYAENVEDRLRSLNNSSAVPFAFRLCATYEVKEKGADKIIHSIIDNLNEDLRAIDTINDRQRVREFFQMSAEDAVSILENIAKISNTLDNFKRIEANEKEKEFERIAEENRKQARRSSFKFSLCDINTGEKIQFIEDKTKEATVYDDKNVEYEGEIYSLSKLAQKLKGTDGALQGPIYFTYNGIILDELRKD